MIPGTTPNNFAVFRGGYNCRHSAIPFKLTKSQKAELDKQQIKNNTKLLRYKITKEEILEIIAGECAVPGIIALIGSYNNKEYLNKLENPQVDEAKLQIISEIDIFLREYYEQNYNELVNNKNNSKSFSFSPNVVLG